MKCVASILLTVLLGLAAVQAAPEPATENQNLLFPLREGLRLLNHGWDDVTEGQASAEFQMHGEELEVRVTRAAAVPENVRLLHTLKSLPPGDYRLSLTMRASSPRTVSVQARRASPPYANLGVDEKLDLDSGWKVGSWVFTVAPDDGPISAPVLMLGGGTGSIWLRDPRLERLPDGGHAGSSARNLLPPNVAGNWYRVENAHGRMELNVAQDTVEAETVRVTPHIWQLQFGMRVPSLPAGTYSLRFSAHADRKRWVEVVAQQINSPACILNGGVQLDRPWKDFEYSFDCPGITNGVNVPGFVIGNDLGPIWVRNIRLTAVSESADDPVIAATLKAAPLVAQLPGLSGVARSAAHREIGKTLLNGGDPRGAAEHLRQAVAEPDPALSPAERAELLENLGRSETQLGRFDAGLEALTMATKAQDGASLRTALGETYEAMGSYDAALENLSRALQAAETARDELRTARCLRDLARIHTRLGKIPEAVAEIRRSRGLLESRPADAELMLTLVEEGAVVESAKEDDAAFQAYTRALVLLGDPENDIRTAARCYRGLAEVARSRGDEGSAAASYSHALELARHGGARLEAAAILGALARSQSRLPGQAAAAEKNFQQAVYEFEALSISDASQLGQLQQAAVGDLYARYAEALILAGRAPEALAVFERGRARGLAQQAAANQIDLTQRFTDAERNELAAREQAASAAGRALRAAQEKLERAEIIEQRRQARERAESDLTLFREGVYGRHPELGNLSAARAVPPAELLEFSRKEPKTLFLAYACLDDMLLRFILRDGVVSASRIPLRRDDLAGRVHRWRDTITDRLQGEAGQARDLYDALLDGIGLSSAGRVVIAADGPLLNLPFAALLTPANRRLVELCPLSLAFSLHSLSWSPPNRPAERSMLCVADPTGTKGELLHTALRDGFNALPAAREEARSLASLYPGGTTLAGDQAREAVVKREMGRYRLLHFATHGVMESRQGMLSALILAPEQAGSAEDGVLTAREIADMRLSAQLAVLSACETARGQASGGEGLLGLAWSFRAAGCPAILASQWKVEDRATRELMVQFYGSLKAGRSKPAALRDAMLAVKKVHPEPFFWSAFQLIGDPKPVPAS